MAYCGIDILEDNNKYLNHHMHSQQQNTCVWEPGSGNWKWILSNGSPGEFILPVTSTLISAGLEVLFPMGETVLQ